MPQPQPPQLDYSPQTLPWHRTRRVRRWIALGTVAVLLLAALGWGPEAWTRLRVAYWMRRCMAYTAPPSQVVYEEDPVSAQELLSSPDYAPAFNNPHFAVFCPAPWREFSLGVIRSDGLVDWRSRRLAAFEADILVMKGGGGRNERRDAEEAEEAEGAGGAGGEGSERQLASRTAGRTTRRGASWTTTFTVVTGTAFFHPKSLAVQVVQDAHPFCRIIAPAGPQAKQEPTDLGNKPCELRR